MSDAQPSKMETALSLSTEAIAYTNLTGQLEWCNAGFSQLINQSVANITGRKVIDLLPLSQDEQPLPPAHHPVTIALAQLPETPLVQAYEFQREAQVLTLEIRCTATADGAVLVIQDMTRVKHVEAEVLQQNRQLLALQLAAAAITSTLALQRVLTMVTGELTSLLSMTHCAIMEWDFELEIVSILAEHGPHHWWEQYVPGGTLSLLEYPLMRQVLADREAMLITLHSQHRDAAEMDFLRSNQAQTMLLMPMVSHSRVIGLACLTHTDLHTLTDQEVEMAQLLANQAAISVENARLFEELRQAKTAAEQAQAEAEAANRAKSTFLANMSHELRTPLNAVIGYSEMLVEEAEMSGFKDIVPDLKKIHTAGSNLLLLISSILDLSKIEAGRMDLFIETFDVADLVRGVVTTIYPLIEKNNNKLEVNMSPAIGLIHADATKIRQILFNLLSNAAKFTHQGQVTLTIARNEVDQEVVFRVNDTGIGMDTDQLTRVFTAFTQADASVTRRYGGTGLGLAISKHFCEMMQGTINVESKPGQGSSFTVRLPIHVSSLTQTSSSVIPDPEPIYKNQVGTVLAIDDDANSRDLIKRYLTKEGFWVETATTGEQGIRLAAKLRPDIILLDVVMPGMDGWAVLTTLKDNPEVAHIPVILLTMTDNREMGLALGAAEYLTKPVNREALVSTIQQYRQDIPLPKRNCLLLIEDDVAVRRLMAHILRMEGWFILEASNGDYALKQMSQQMPHVILLDLMMPGMDGFEFVATLRQNPNWQSVPIVVITAKQLTKVDYQRLQGRVDHILYKGINIYDDVLKYTREFLT